ncbi:MAG: hypothetical protein U9Q33_11605 [Campylobacterota bacterium]|nr:hypothetical protein [Campylobacterota bacterium]
MKNEALWVLTGTVVGYLFNFLTQTIQNVHELKKLEINNKFKLSEATYQKLFEKKIDVYIELHKKLMAHKSNLLNVGFFEYDYNDYEGHIESEISDIKAYLF